MAGEVAKGEGREERKRQGRGRCQYEMGGEGTKGREGQAGRALHGNQVPQGTAPESSEGRSAVFIAPMPKNKATRESSLERCARALP